MEESFEKPSFLIYKHHFESVGHLSNEDLGLLFRTICKYQNDKKSTILMLILELCKLFGSSRHSLIMMIKSI